jgi:hypothetical protein
MVNSVEWRQCIKPDGFCVLRAYHISLTEKNEGIHTHEGYANADFKMDDVKKRDTFISMIVNMQYFIKNKIDKKPVDGKRTSSESVESRAKAKIDRIKSSIDKFLAQNGARQIKEVVANNSMILTSDEQIDPALCRNLINEEDNKKIYWWTDNQHYFPVDFDVKSYSQKFMFDENNKMKWVTLMTESKEIDFFSSVEEHPLAVSFKHLLTLVTDQRAHHFCLSAEHAVPIPFLKFDQEQFVVSLIKKLKENV